MSSKANGKPPDEPEGVKGSEFPKATLEDSLRVATGIEAANGGQPLPPIETANAIGLSPASSAFPTLLSASSRRGLTIGAHTSKTISVLETGRDIVNPMSEHDARKAIRKAALAPPVFGAAYNHYRGKKYPEQQYLMSTLTREFGVPPKDAKRCAEIFRADMEYAGLLVDTKAGYFLTDDLEGRATATTTLGVALREMEPVHNVDMESSLGATAPEVPTIVPPIEPLTPRKPEPPKAIFVGHGKDKTALTQLTKILDELGLPYKVAEYEANAGRPISQKVADLMDECGAAILIFSADRELRDMDGNPVWLSSENVANELGAATVLYNGRIVVFKEATVDLASNYSGIGYIEFEKGKLSAHAMDLFREIRHFGLITISVGE